MKEKEKMEIMRCMGDQMKKHIIPDYVMKCFQANPLIGRIELAKAVNITETEARFYCRVYSAMTEGIKPKSRGIALFDIHYPTHDKAALNVVKQFIKDFKPDHLVYGGDQLDMDTLSVFNIKKPKLLEGKRLKQEYRDFDAEILKPIEQAVPSSCKKYFIIGNHEYRVDRYIERNPQVEGFYEVKNNLDLSD